MVVCSGVGLENARTAARRLAARQIEGLVVLGISGALNPGLEIGDLVVPDSVVLAAWGGPADIRPLSTELTHCFRTCLAKTGRRVQGGRLVTSRRPAASAFEKRLLHREWGGAAVDMETWAVAEVAAQAGIPVAVLRAVSDRAQDDIPPAVLGWINARGAPQPAVILSSLARHPTLMFSLLRLRKNMRRALSSLRTAWQACRGPVMGKHPISSVFSRAIPGSLTNSPKSDTKNQLYDP
jgi:hypothetical protein